MERRSVYYSGHVQGVGFRYTTQAVAAGFAVTGYVRNRLDGRVELVAEGTAAELDAFLESVARKMEDKISAAQIESGAATGEFADFSVRS